MPLLIDLLFTTEKSRVKAPLKGSKLSMKNRLINGTLIELSGVTLLWQTDTDKIVEEKQRKLNEMFAQHQQKGMKCPISLSRLGVMEEFGGNIDSKAKSIRMITKKVISDAPSSQAYVYSKCGHVQGDSQWGKTGLNPTSYTCCLCIQESEGRLPLRFVNEPRIHLDSDELQYCFNPCGHVVSLKTAEFWSELDYPNRHTGIFTHHCPFCKAELSQINPYVRLIFENYQIVNAGA